MLYLHHRPEIMNKGVKFQSTDLGRCLVCKNETRIMGVRHVRI